MIGNNGINNVSPLRKTFKNDFEIEDKYMNLKENRFPNEFNKDNNNNNKDNILKGSLTSLTNNNNNNNNISTIYKDNNNNNNNTWFKGSLTSFNNVSINKETASPENLYQKNKVK